MQQAHIFISGFVQGVGFRQLIKKNAQKMGIAGWARNTKDNRVEAVFQLPGVSAVSRKSIAELINICRKGPFLAEVKDITVSWEKVKEEYTDFQIRL